MNAFNLVLLLAAAGNAMASHIQGRNHHEIAVRQEGHLAKRFYSPRVTWYPTNTGPDACTGKNHGDGDEIVAINTAQWNGGKICGRRIRITVDGKSHTGVIQDLCASCPEPGQIDLTKGLFQRFAPLSRGIFTATWEFADGSDNDNDDPPPKPKPTKKPAYTPTAPKSTKKVVKPKTTSKPKPKPTPSTTKSVTPSSTTESSTSSVIPPVSVAPAVPPANIVPPTQEDDGVANAGTNPEPSQDASGISGGIASDGVGNGAVAVSLNGLVAGAAAFLVLVQAL